jgi:hypothetical protein
MLSRLRKKYWRAPLAVVCQLLVLQPVLAQQPAGGQRSLRIVVVEGEGSRNVVQQIPPRPLIVRIDDANGRPVQGAIVTFTAPQIGPSGEFENDQRTLRVVTGPDGLVSAGEYHPNAITGQYQIRVNVEFQGETAVSLISQTNVEERRGKGKLIAVLAIVGAAAAAVVAFRNKDNNGPDPANTPTITFGGSAVGAPR